MSKRIYLLTETAIIVAVAMALSFIPDIAGWYSPSFGVIPIILFALRRGPAHGLTAGFLWGILHFPMGKVYFVSANQVILEYVVAFTLVGLAGIMYAKFQNALAKQHKPYAITWALLGAFIAIFARYTCHYWAGVIFFAEYAPEGMSPELYSLSVNGPAGLATFIITSIVLIALVTTQALLFVPKKLNR